jgi:hypothetical protein
MNNLKFYKSAVIYHRLSKLTTRKREYNNALGGIKTEYLRMRYMLFIWM